MFLREVNDAARKLPPDNEKELQQLIELYGDVPPGKFLEGVYLYSKGVQVRGDNLVRDTARDKMDAMREILGIALERFDIVLANDPDNHLAYAYKGAIQAFAGAQERGGKDGAFKQALAINPSSFKVWNDYLWFNHRHWGGSNKKLESLLSEMESQITTNPDLKRLKGVLLADEASIAVRNGRLEQGEALVFEALEFGTVSSYRQVVDILFRKVQMSGDRAGACRISKKYHTIDPANTRYKDLVDSC